MKMQSLPHGQRFDPAKYIAGIPGEEGNPFIEALPSIMSADVFRYSLTRYLPKITAEERNLPVESRLVKLGQIRELVQPTERDVKLALEIQEMLRTGYLERNPVGPGFSHRLLRGAAAEAAKTRGVRSSTKPLGKALLGMSGLGKSTTIDAILDCWPLGKSHSCYRGREFRVDQLFQLRISCPKSATLVGLLRKIIAALDEALGENYTEKTGARRASSTQLEIDVRKLCLIHGVGIIVIDEFQNIRAGTPGEQDRLLNFVTGLMNDWGVPVIFIATDWAAPLFNKSFMVARRSGTCALLFKRPTYDEFRIFLMVLWTQQVVDVPVAFETSWLDTFWEVTAGIYDLAVKLFVATQRRALNGSAPSTMTPELVQETWNVDFKMLHVMMKQIRAGRPPTNETFEFTLRSIDPLIGMQQQSSAEEKEVSRLFPPVVIGSPEDSPPAATEPSPTVSGGAAAPQGGKAPAQRKSRRAPAEIGNDADPSLSPGPTLEQIAADAAKRGLGATAAFKEAAARRRAAKAHKP